MSGRMGRRPGPTKNGGGGGGRMPVSVSLSATQVCTAGPSATKSCAFGSTFSMQASKYGYLSLSLQPNDERSGRAAVRIIRLLSASAGTNTPEKQVEMITMVGRRPQALEII